MINRTFFNAHHSPPGAFASFTLGFKGASGGLGIELAGPANQNVYIGLQSRDTDIYEFLPFYGNAVNDRARYDSSGVDKSEIKTIPYPDKDISRSFGLGSDIWIAQDLTLKIYSPVMPIPDPHNAPSEALKRACIPAVFVEITVDNSGCSKQRGAVFGFQGSDPYSSMRHICGDTNKFLCGIGQGLHAAIITGDKDVESGLVFSIDDLIFPKNKAHLGFGLGNIGGLIFTVPAHEKKTWKFVVCFYRGGNVTAGTGSTYFYTQYFSSVEDVAAYGLLHFDYYRERAVLSDKMVLSSELSQERIFSLCHSIRSYCGSTEFLLIDNKPCWIVNEGEYRMINTLDLTVDHLFFEMKMNPWTVKNVLDKYVDDYSYYDNFGLSFTHDMGAGNVFSGPRRSVYELGGLSGCFSFMTHEMLVNWVLCATVYYAQTGDLEWLQKHKAVIIDCLSSLMNRDHRDQAHRDGVMDFDSDRTIGGEEITTYDNVDSSLGRARRNTYLAVKTWAAYLGLEYLFNTLSQGELSGLAREQAVRCSDTICNFVKDDGTLPALLEENNGSVLLPVIEGLAFPWFFNRDLLAVPGPFSKLIDVLKVHCTTVLKKRTCLFEDNGWRLSSTSNNSWLSKIYLCQFVAEKILGLPQDFNADTAHVNWLLDEDNSYFAWSDQIMSGKVCASRYYPRGVTSILWL